MGISTVPRFGEPESLLQVFHDHLRRTLDQCAAEELESAYSRLQSRIPAIVAGLTLELQNRVSIRPDQAGFRLDVQLSGMPLLKVVDADSVVDELWAAFGDSKTSPPPGAVERGQVKAILRKYGICA